MEVKRDEEIISGEFIIDSLYRDKKKSTYEYQTDGKENGYNTDENFEFMGQPSRLLLEKRVGNFVVIHPKKRIISNLKYTFTNSCGSLSTSANLNIYNNSPELISGRGILITHIFED